MLLASGAFALAGLNAVNPRAVPIKELVESVTKVELMPWAKGIRAVVAVCPSLVIAVVKPVAKSAVSKLNAVAVMTVPATTG